MNVKYNDQDSGSQIQLVFEIQDTGVGISPEEQDKIFDAFVQTESGRQSGQGTGLGLPISLEYVRMMGGDISVESEPGKGSRFRFTIQAETLAPHEIDAIVASSFQRRVVELEPGSHAPDGGPFRILVIDDVAESRKLLVNLLHPLGFQVQTADNGQAGIDAWETWHPHLIFMDMRMPIMDGSSTARAIKSRIAYATLDVDTTIVALTASAFEEDREDLLRAGCDDFIHKPFRATTIFEVLARHLDLQFVYAEANDEKSSGVQDRDAIQTQIKNLEPEWIKEMHQAAQEGDLAWMETLTAQIQAPAPQLAGRLTQLLYNFEYNKVLELILSENKGSDK